MRFFAAIQTEAGHFGSFLREGELFAYVRLFQNLKDLNIGRFRGFLSDFLLISIVP